MAAPPEPILNRKSPGTFLLFHLPAVAYAALIYYISSLQHIHPPSFGMAWDDKIYHFGEYAVFSILIFIALKYYRAGFIARHVHVWAVTVPWLFAVTDEIHQYYVPGRDATLGDLAADFLGAVCAQVFLIIILRYIRQKRVD